MEYKKLTPNIFLLPFLVLLVFNLIILCGLTIVFEPISNLLKIILVNNESPFSVYDSILLDQFTFAIMLIIILMIFTVISREKINLRNSLVITTAIILIQLMFISYRFF